mgnify:CR=1 FL=1
MRAPIEMMELKLPGIGPMNVVRVAAWGVRNRSKDVHVQHYQKLALNI